MIKLSSKGFYCEPGNFYIDPWRPVDTALITHGHADHARSGMKKYVCHQFSVPILKSRIGSDIQIQGVQYQETLYVNGVKVSFHPAGHIIGSAQIRLEYKGRIIVFSGDYKIQDDGLSTPFESVKCHEFVTESTFGLPIYNWLSVEAQNLQLQQWVLQNHAAGKNTVIVGYSLGKAQRIMKALDGIAALNVHYSIHKLNEAYERVGIKLPRYQPIDLRENLKGLEKAVIIVPPSLLNSNVIKKIPNMVHAICSGWMQVRGARRWRSADAGFAMSDHADWNGLLTAVKETGAEKVYVTHGQTEIFSKYINELGIEAHPVKTEYGEEEEDREEKSTGATTNNDLL
jgi:putative mRNA 3-end processing factor